MRIHILTIMGLALLCSGYPVLGVFFMYVGIVNTRFWS